MRLSVGDAAPNFSTADQLGKRHTLKDYQGKWILLYFYPKDFTSGCTTEACGLRDNFTNLSTHITIVGVSPDSIESHKKFAQEYTLLFTLLADPKKEMIKAYGTDGVLFTKRTSFLVDPNGIIKKIYERVNPETHAQEILNDISRLRK